MIHVLVSADDRTGALETAGSCADIGLGGVRVVSLSSGDAAGLLDGSDASLAVVDLGTRNASIDMAVATVTRTAALGVRRIHKIDSSLRGSWAHELAALADVRGERVLVVPALPALGRICRDGVVLVHGVPVHEGAAGADARAPVTSSRPAEHLAAAGVSVVSMVRDVAGLDAWLQGRGTFAVCDASTDTEIVEIAARWARSTGVVLAGPAAVASAGAAGLVDGSRSFPEQPVWGTPVVVVCGSLHPVARAQVATLATSDLVDVQIVVSPPADSVLVSAEDALRCARDLADDALARAGTSGSLVVLGGDTAAAVLGATTVVVGGTIAPGTPWMTTGDGRVVVTRSGGFGPPDALVTLLTGDGSDRMEP